MSGEITSWRERAHRSLSALTAAQKFSAGVLIAVMIAAGVWLTHSTASGPMEPVLDQAFADADVSQISHRLSEKKVPHEVRDGKVYVPADRKMEVLSDLIYSDTLTGNTESGFDALVKESSIFDSPSKTDKLFNHARETMLQGVISQFRGVRKARVLIDPTNERHINGGSITPTALVDIQTRGNEASPRQLASAAVNALTGAVSTMLRERVKVTIDGASYNLGSEEFGDDLLERRQQCEQAQVAKVRQLLSYIPDVLVSVSVDLNVQSVEEEKHIYDPDNSIELKAHTETRVEQAAPSESPPTAVMANGVPALADKTADAPSLAANVRSENTKTDYTALSAETISKSKTPAGKETVLSASVVVPRGYFAQLYRRGAAKAAEPTDALLQPVIDTQLLKIRHLVRNSLGLKNDSDVTVEVYEDGSSTAATPLVASVPRQEALIVPPLATLWNHRTQWGLVIFGAATLLLVSTMLRRGSGAMAAPQPLDLSAEPVGQTHVPHAERTSRPDFGSDGEQADHNGDGTREMAMAQHLDPAERAGSLAEFAHASSVQQRHLAPVAPFASIQEAETQALLDSIRDEHPQTIALVLAHLPPAKAGEILEGLPTAKQVEVVKRIAGIEQTSSEVIEQVERGLRQRLGHIIGQTIRSGGVSAVAEILNSADRRTEREILHSLEHDAPNLAERIRSVQGILDDLLHAPDADVRAVVEQLDAETISLALRTAPERLVRKVLWNLPGEEAARIERDLQSVEPVRISDIEAAQHRVAEIVERLTAGGDISAAGSRRKPRGERKGETV